MFAPILVFAVAVALVVTYILIVHRLLRSDEHWNESSQPMPSVSRERATASVTNAGRSASFTPNHA